MATVEDLKAEMRRKLMEARERLGEAKEQVRKYEEFLSSLNKLDRSETPAPLILRPEEIQPPLPSLKSEKADSVGRAVKQVIAVADGEFDMRGLAQAINSKFPYIPKDVLYRRVSAILYRLVKRNEIAIVEKGSGSAPNTYRRAAELPDKEEEG